MNAFNIWNIGDDYLEEEDVIEYEDEAGDGEDMDELDEEEWG